MPGTRQFTEHAQRRRGVPWAFGLGVLCWASLAVTGFWLLSAHETTPGEASAAAARWPEDSPLVRDPERPTLLLFAHPSCPCTRATVGELNRLMAQCQGRVAATVVFFKPSDTADQWERTDLWRSAAAIPGVAVRVDVDGRDAARFGARTSGTLLVYATDGRLLFGGGITASRGHAGDNLGRDAVVTLLHQGQPERTTTPVFGCPLFPSPATESCAPCK